MSSTRLNTTLKYLMAVRKFTNIFVLLLILMVGSRDTLFLVCFTKKCTDRPTVAAPKCQPSEDEPSVELGKKKVFINGIRVWIPTRYVTARFINA